MNNKRNQFRSLGRDLFYDLECTCPSSLFIGTEVEHIMKHDIKLTGYADNYFFDTVNAEPRFGKCKCGRKFTYQWFRDGVVAYFLDEQEDN